MPLGIKKNISHIPRLGQKHVGINKIGQKLKQIDRLPQKIGGKIVQTAEQVDPALRKIQHTAQKTSNILSAANKAGLSQVPLVGQASVAIQKGASDVAMGSRIGRKELKKLKAKGAELEKTNLRKIAQQKLAEYDSSGNFA